VVCLRRLSALTKHIDYFQLYSAIYIYILYNMCVHWKGRFYAINTTMQSFTFGETIFVSVTGRAVFVVGVIVTREGETLGLEACFNFSCIHAKPGFQC
jgi:hypothetical protein